MAESNDKKTDSILQEVLKPVPDELPERILRTYARLWQLEIWLRRMLYIELRAAFGDSWNALLEGARAERSREADQRLTHMPTPEADLLSYASLPELCRVISEAWDLFEIYFLPKELWEAKLEEIKQIRHRVAHFRAGHRDDLQRVTQFLRDIDRGFWHFCTSYNDPRPVTPPTDDPVVLHFLHLDPFPWSDVGDGKWVRIGVADPNAYFGMTIEVLHRPWLNQNDRTQIAGSKGRLYDVAITGRGGRTFDYDRFLKHTASLHRHFVHIRLDGSCQMLEITIPTILGSEQVIRLVEKIVESVPYCFLPSYISGADAVQAFADTRPEYVLGPHNPLTFLDPRMPCSFFGV